MERIIAQEDRYLSIVDDDFFDDLPQEQFCSRRAGVKARCELGPSAQ